MAEIKDALRVRGLSANGSKAELIQRLTKADPNVWASMYRQITVSVTIDEEFGEPTEESELNPLTNTTDTPQLRHWREGRHRCQREAQRRMRLEN